MPNMTKKRQSYYMVIPSEVWDASITARAMLLYGHITVLANKLKFCYANNNYFEKVMKSSPSSIGRAMKELEDCGLIRRELVYKEGSKEIEKRKIYLTAGMVSNEPTGIDTCDNRPVVIDDYRPIVTSNVDNTTRNNTIKINKIDVEKGKVFFKIVELYPPNRIGNRQHGLKKFKDLEVEDCKLALKNLHRYLDLAGGYVKTLQNYLGEGCYTEKWLDAETKNKIKKESISNQSNTKTFKGNYDDSI